MLSDVFLYTLLPESNFTLFVIWNAVLDSILRVVEVFLIHIFFESNNMI